MKEETKEAVSPDEVRPDNALYSVEDWRNTTVPWLPFLEWHEYVSLGEIGSTVLSMPFSPFFSLFLAKDSTRRRKPGYEETDWKVDRRFEGRVRTVRYFSEESAVVESQRCALRSDVLVFESRVEEEGMEALVERWEVREQRGYVKASTQIRWRGGPFSSSARCRTRFENWKRYAQDRSYSDAVATMLSDSIFGIDVPPTRKVSKAASLYWAPVPPTRVDSTLSSKEPPLAEGETTTVEKLPFVKSATLVTGDGHFTTLDQPEDLRNEPIFGRENTDDSAPFGDFESEPATLGASSPPWNLHANDKQTRDKKVSDEPLVVKRRAPGEFYVIEFLAPVPGLLQFADVGGLSVVDGRDTAKATRAAATSVPSIGAALVSVNGVRVNGLSFAATMGLLNAATPPLAVTFVEPSPEQLADSLAAHFGGEDDVFRCKGSELEAGLASTPKLKDQLDDFVASFNKCDLAKLAASSDRSKRPGPMFWSAIDFACRYLQDKKILPRSMDYTPQVRRKRLSVLTVSSSQRSFNDENGGGGPGSGGAAARYWLDVRRHLEKRVMDQIYEAATASSEEDDAELSAHLARLQFLKLADLGVVIKNEEIDEESRPEWTVATLELAQVGKARTATEALERLASSVRFVASAVEASSNRGKPLAAYSAIGADELLPAITWTVIRANPYRLASTLSFVESYADEELLRSEMGYAFANVSAAVNFAQSTLTNASPLEGLISKADFDKGVKNATLAHKAVDAANRRDARQLRLLFASGADPCGLSIDQTTTPLIATIDSKNGECVRAALDHILTLDNDKSVDLDVKIAGASRQGQTALCAAAEVGDLDTVCALIKLRANPNVVDAKGLSASRLARAAGNIACAEVLEAGDPHIDPVTAVNPLVRACADANGPKTRGLLLRGGDADAVCGKLGCPPLVAASAVGSLACVLALLPYVKDVDACARVGPFAGQTALMRSVGLDPDAARAAADACDENDDASAADKGEQKQPSSRGLLTGMVSRIVGGSRRPLRERRIKAAVPDVQVYIATRLLAAGASRGKVDASGRTALTWAETAGGDPRLVAVLRNTPSLEKIYVKARDRKAGGVYALLEQGVDADAACPDKGYTALIAAAYNDDVGLATFLVDPPTSSLPARLEDPDFFFKKDEEEGRPRLRWRPADVNLAGRGGLTPLMYAAQKRSHGLVTLLLRKGAEREAKDDRGRTALDHAEASRRATDGSDASLREQLRELLSVDPRKMLLVEAAARDDGAKVAALIAQGASPNECRRIHSGDGWHLELCTPLIAACAYDSRRAATALLDAPGVRVDLANPAGLTPLMYAAHRGSSTMLLTLLRAGASRSRKDRLGRTALDWARRRARQDADALSRASLSRESRQTGVDRADKLAVPLLRWDPLKHTTQQLAAAGEVDGVVALVKQGVDVNAVDRAQQHETALLACCATREKAVLEKLLSHPAIQVDLESSRGVTPLMQAAAAGFDDGVLKLLRAGARRYAKTPQGRVAADYATEHGHMALAAVLQADPNQVSIHDVSTQGKLLLLDGLLRQRPELLNFPDNQNGDPPLILASANKRLKAVELLLRYPDVLVDQTNDRKETALMHAAKAGALDICSRLLSKGASSRAKDNMGRNATSWASMRSYSNMMLYLGLVSVS